MEPSGSMPLDYDRKVGIFFRWMRGEGTGNRRMGEKETHGPETACGRPRSTLRKVLEYSAASTLSPCGQHSAAFHGLQSGKAHARHVSLWP